MILIMWHVWHPLLKTYVWDLWWCMSEYTSVGLYCSATLWCCHAQSTVCMQSTVLWLHAMPIVHHCEQCCITLSQVSQLTKDWIGEPAVQCIPIKSKARWDLGVKVIDVTVQFATCIPLCHPLLTLASATLHCIAPDLSTQNIATARNAVLLPLCCVALRLQRIFFTCSATLQFFRQ